MTTLQRTVEKTGYATLDTREVTFGEGSGLVLSKCHSQGRSGGMSSAWRVMAYGTAQRVQDYPERFRSRQDAESRFEELLALLTN